MGRIGRNTLELQQILNAVTKKNSLNAKQQQKLVFLREESTMLDRAVGNKLASGNSADPKLRRLKGQYEGLHKGFVDISKLSERVEREYIHQIERNTGSERNTG